MIFSKTSLYMYSNGRKRQRDRFKTVCHIGLRLYVCNTSRKRSAGNLQRKLYTKEYVAINGLLSILLNQSYLCWTATCSISA